MESEEPGKEDAEQRFGIGEEGEYASVDEVVDNVDYDFLTHLLRRFAVDTNA